MNDLTLFSFGYWGWGSVADRLRDAVDAVEIRRGHEAPRFIDIRYSRSVRAKGFNGNAFHRCVGADRYQWIRNLGNEANQSGGMRIHNSQAVDRLIDQAQECAAENQRLLFFCACEIAGIEGQGAYCHRIVVARLVLEAAESRKIPLRIVEWPGGDANLDFPLVTTSDVITRLRGGGKFIPLAEPFDLTAVAGLPWGSVVSVRDRITPDETKLRCLTGPARYRTGRGWCLPVFRRIDSSDAMTIRGISDAFRHERGLNARTAS